VEWGIFIAGLSNAKQVASLVAMCWQHHALHGKQSSNKQLCVYIIKV
jgi:hypothetical protein